MLATSTSHRHAARQEDIFPYLKIHNTPPNNRAIHNLAEIIKAVMSSVAKVKLGALYINARKAVKT